MCERVIDAALVVGVLVLVVVTLLAGAVVALWALNG